MRCEGSDLLAFGGNHHGPGLEKDNKRQKDCRRVTQNCDLQGEKGDSHRVLDTPAGEQGLKGTSLTRQFGIVVIEAVLPT